MLQVAVVTDSTHYLPAALAVEAGLRQVSLYVNDGARQRREADIDDLDAFYGALRSAASMPTTSQPSIGDFLSVYEPLAADGLDIVSVHLAGGISGTVEAARQAGAELTARVPGRRVEVVDSELACGALGLVALAAAAAARGGAGADAVVARAREARAATRLWFAVDTLEYLRRGGRIGTAQAWLGGALKIKPILSVDGEITPVERVRTSGRAFERMVEYLRSQAVAGSDGWVVQHIQAPDVAARLVERGREIFGSEPLFVSEVGPVIGAHVGPGLVGVGGLPRALVG
ncbi:MAG: fatty acid kinase fatty acid binding subunit [Solirubrobacteraceae bacterium]|jgi:DegV family protein with EDD domain|nr:fatty acid kinase fatty acid binding subunit [Solirubrobacteraceae bacterium]MEA2278815.1 fatty acid kinase fatty acid binding subunit [Solirubrobacteraceae bacterium]